MLTVTLVRELDHVGAPTTMLFYLKFSLVAKISAARFFLLHTPNRLSLL